MSEPSRKGGAARRAGEADAELRDAVEGLLAERQRFAEWIEALEARRDDAPQHVYERVRADYGKRLAEVDAKLAQQLPALEGYTGRIDARIQSLHERMQELRDKRAEAELRAHVGELASGEWERQAREHDDRIAKVAAEAEQLAQQRERARALLLAATPATGVAAVSETAASAAKAAPARELSAPGSGEPQPASADHAERRTSGAFANELDFLRSVAGEAQDGAPAETKAAPHTAPVERAEKPAAPAAAASPAAAPLPAAEPKPAESTPEAAAQPPKVETRPIDPSLGIQVGTGLERADPLAGVNAKGTELSSLTGSVPIVLRSENVQQRTLRCAECGAMNFPTEWYCEKCGAELAAL